MSGTICVYHKTGMQVAPECQWEDRSGNGVSHHICAEAPIKKAAVHVSQESTERW